jgi:hypothetical protein
MGAELKVYRIAPTVLEGMMRNPEEFHERAIGDAVPVLDLYKNYRELVIGLTGTDEQDGSLLSTSIFGGSSFDCGASEPVPSLDPGEVARVAAALGDVDEAAFLSRVINEVGGPEPGVNESLAAEFVALLRECVTFYQTAAARGEAVLMWWS